MPTEPAAPPERLAETDDSESFDDYMRRHGFAPPAKEPPKTLFEDAQDAVRRHREQCRRTLREGINFKDLRIAVERLPRTRREQWALNAAHREIFRAQDLGDVWLYLETGARMERGRTSDWPDRMNAAFLELDRAFGNLQEVAAQHPSFRLNLFETWIAFLRDVRDKGPQRVVRGPLDLIRFVTQEECWSAYRQLRGCFRRPPRKGRPHAEWRSLTILLLRKTGVSRHNAEHLANLAGLTAGAPPVTPSQRRRKAALQKARVRRTHRSEKQPLK